MMLGGCGDWNFLVTAEHPIDFEELVGAQ